jgi:hypothetical protein
MGSFETKIEVQKMIADVYSRAYAAAMGNDGLVPEVEAKQAVRKFMGTMNEIDPAIWSWYKGKLDVA